MAGRKPTPTAVLKLRGTYRNDRHGNALYIDPSLPPCPYYLPNRAKKVWREAVRRLSAAGVLTELDGNALTRYCDAFIRWRDAAAFLDKNGTYYPVRDENGRLKHLRQFPQVLQYNSFNRALLSLEQEFGMTPSSRSRINAPTENIRDDTSKERFFKSG